MLTQMTTAVRKAFLVIAMGGTGRAALRTFMDRYAKDGSPFPLLTIAADTEPITDDAARAKIELALTDDDLTALNGDPKSFGPIAQLMTSKYDWCLDRDASGNGSRTTRIYTQLAMEVHRHRVLRTLYQSIRDLYRGNDIDSILPVFLCSTGGGAGSALMILFALLFADAKCRARMTEGLSPYLLDKPFGIVTEPFAFAIKHLPNHAAKILANAYAFRIESAQIERRNCFQYLMSQGMANEGGAMLDTEREIASSLGTVAFQMCRNWGYYKARAVDTLDGGKNTDRFRGSNLPELQLAEFSRNGKASAEPVSS